ncbi:MULTISPECIES: metal/formaldehyde-sensitive transcriptional repressor [unclassified Paludibacterium]|uniref:metal/formaldehyde-sensitive transcriptional repressor n=1 Tax=unclassified Paludibacterium TaxID=2618429 RepID=UPI00207B62CE|nr:metal/formaldehyde-sensitive transcriptional repressor [Paludibacterium sp. B53371]BEV70860.1 metal/formaldehyde-sensitive transcriptional repressor [Paludibacterium sp. THUN1379]
MPHNNRAVLTRVRRIIGQAQALEAALLQQTDCHLVLQQLAAVRGAVNGLMAEVLDGYMRTHLMDGGSTEEKREQDMAQVSRVLHAYLK